MKQLLYTVIKTRKQYNEYCDILWELVKDQENYEKNEDAIELLEMLIGKWDEENNTHLREEIDPVQMLKFMMESNYMKAADLSRELNIGKSLVSDILNYKKGMSKEVIRKLSKRFGMVQEAFNRPYPLVATKKKSKPVPKTRINRSKKKLVESYA